MKKLIFIALLSFFGAQGQENTKEIVVGDILTVGAPSAQYYKYVYFPKTNFIIKKGGIPNYNALIGNRVVVTEVAKQDGYTKVSFKKDDGKKFFNSITTVNANLEKALKEKEILLVK